MVDNQVMIKEIEDEVESAKRFEFILRLDRPYDRATYQSNTVPVEGWFLFDEFIADTLPKVEILIEELSGLKSPLQVGVLGSSEILRLNHEFSSAKRPALKSFHISPSAQSIAEVDPDLSGKMFRFSGEIELESTELRSESVSRLYSVCAIAQLENWRAISNKIVFTHAGETFARRGIGGFLSPSAQSVHGDFVVVSAWALRGDDVVTSAVLNINQRPVSQGEVGLESPLQERSLPDIAGSSNCGILSVIDNPLLRKAGISEREIKKPLELSFEITFRSGEKLVLEGMSCRLIPQEKTERVFGKIETASYAEDGRTCIGGWLISDDSEQAELFLSWSRGSTVLGDPHLQWSNRPDIAVRYPHLDIGLPVGFTIEIPLGRVPGYVSLNARSRTAGWSFDFGPSLLTSALGKLSVQDAPLWEQMAQSGVSLVQGAKRAFTSFSKKKRDFSETVQRSGTLVFSHNLSATEGAPKVLFEVIEHLVREQAGIGPCVVVSPVEGELEDNYRSLGCEVEIIRELDPNHSTVEQLQLGRRRLNCIFETYRPQLVYANSIDSYFAVFSAEERNIPRIWAIHESVDPFSYSLKIPSCFQYMFLHSLRTSKSMLFVADTTAKLFVDRCPNLQATSIANSIDVEEIERRRSQTSKAQARKRLGLSESATVVSIIGTTTYRKGQDVFLREMELLRELIPEQEFIFQVVGARANDFYDELCELRDQLRLGEFVQFVFETSNISDYFISSDVMVVASREESAPLVSLEAFAYEVPLVSTLAFGLAEQIDPERNALSFELENSGSLAAQVQRLLMDPSLAKRLCSTAKRDFETRFSRKKQLESYLAAVKLASSAESR